MHLHAAEKSPALEALVNDAAVPAEFAADLFIRIAASPNLDDRTRKRELLENAFMRAYGGNPSSAQHRWPHSTARRAVSREPTPPGSTP
jgi:phytoene dehydrogenase-like protein